MNFVLDERSNDSEFFSSSAMYLPLRLYIRNKKKKYKSFRILTYICISVAVFRREWMSLDDKENRIRSKLLKKHSLRGKTRRLAKEKKEKNA